MMTFYDYPPKIQKLIIRQENLWAKIRKIDEAHDDALSGDELAEKARLLDRIYRIQVELGRYS